MHILKSACGWERSGTWKDKTSMIYNVAQLLKAPVGTAQRVDLDPDDELELEDDRASLNGLVHGQVRLHRTNQGIFVDGAAEVPIQLECTRCLTSFTETVSVPLRELFYPTIDVETGVPVPPPANDDLSFPLDHNHVLDLREAIRQNLLLAPAHENALPGGLSWSLSTMRQKSERRSM